MFVSFLFDEWMYVCGVVVVVDGELDDGRTMNGWMDRLSVV